ncbi:MAG: hypothetical protein RLZZ337_1817 [Bacteroidota bacterium]|jgi:O-antigen/teichoic acid export membrane protein
MSLIKKLASDTAIYGIPSIVGRLLSFLLVFLYTKFNASVFAAHTEFYAYSSFFLVLLPLGMETAFFNFLRKGNDIKTTFTTAFYTVAAMAVFFAFVVIVFRQHVANFMNYPDHSDYVVWFVFIIFFDVLTMVPFALLRHQQKAKRFAFVRSIGIAINISLNVLYFIVFPLYDIEQIPFLYDSNIGIGYAFIANLIASGATALLLLPDITKYIYQLDKDLLKQMLKYGLPLVLVGMAGIVNETFDRVVLDKLLISDNPKFEIGVYGAFYKLSIIITIFIQAFRYAAEPFFFEKSKDKNAPEVYALVMKYFVWVCLSAGLLTLFFLDEIAAFAVRDASYYKHPDGIKIVAPLILANIFLGIIYNLSIWYKVKEKNNIGAVISIFGACITIGGLLIFVPHYGFIAAAYTTLAAYFTMMVVSYIVGQQHFPIPYELNRLFVLFAFAILFYVINDRFLQTPSFSNYFIKLTLIASFVFVGFFVIKQGKNINLPTINRK